MRRHRTHAMWQLWANLAQRPAIEARTLAVARFEPVSRQFQAAAALDLAFVSEGRVAVVPMVLIEASMAIEPEVSPLIWPQSVASTLDPLAADGVEALLLPWLYALVGGRQCNAEAIRRFGNAADCEAFEQAREHGFLGASPYRDVLRASAPYAYAMRFADGAHVQIADPGGATGAVLLSSLASSVIADLGDERRAAEARRWFGRDLFAPLAHREPGQVVVERGDPREAAVRLDLRERAAGTAVDVVSPVPLDVTVSFDLEDGPSAGRFGLELLRQPEIRSPRGAAAPPPVGGSAGRILIALRDDWERLDDADSDEALELARRLRAEGFEVDVRSALAGTDPARYDVVHAFSVLRPQEIGVLLAAAKRQGVPTVLTSVFADVSAQGVWGTGIVPVCYRLARDEARIDEYLGLLARRRLETPELNPRRQEPFAGYDDAVRATLACADIVLAAGPHEEAELRERFGCTCVTTVAPYLDAGTAVEPAAELAGWREFVLAHAPVDPRSNQLTLVRAAAAAGLPLVLAGPVTDAEYLAFVREYADARTVLLTQPLSAGQLAWLYRRARVFADLSWFMSGLSRVARASICGCAVLTSANSPAARRWRPDLFEADPASHEGVAAALKRAWAAAEEPGRPGVERAAARIAADCDPLASLVATLAAYAQVQTAGRL